MARCLIACSQITCSHCTGPCTQESRADNLIKGSKQAQMDQIRADINDFKATSGVDKVVVLWTAGASQTFPFLLNFITFL